MCRPGELPGAAGSALAVPWQCSSALPAVSAAGSRAAAGRGFKHPRTFLFSRRPVLADTPRVACGARRQDGSNLKLGQTKQGGNEELSETL